MRALRRSTLLISLLCCALQASAQNWPARPVRIVVPWTPGGTPDVTGRLLAERLPAIFGQPFVVDNRPGAAGDLGSDYVAKQPGDGYTLLVHGSVASSAPFKQLPFDPFKDFAPISQLAVVVLALVTHSSIPANSVPELIAYARANPGKLTYASVGIGTPQHFSAELVRQQTKLDILHVPYKGAAALAAGLLAGEVGFAVSGANTLLPHVASGRLRLIAVALPTRTTLLPNVPTIAESIPTYDMPTTWLAFYAPAGTPRPIVDRLNTEANKIIRDPQVVKERLHPNGMDPIGSTPEQLLETMKSDFTKYVRIMKEGNIRSD